MVDPNSNFEFIFSNKVLRFQGRIYVGKEGPLRGKLLEKAHFTAIRGHSGIKGTIKRLQQYFYWRTLSKDVMGPQQPGNHIDVYLAPLIEDLKTLWDIGVDAFDANKQEYFTLRAVLLWTINDFPAYGNLSGCTVKGYFACPISREGTNSCWLKHCKKNAYMGHRKFLPINHPYRRLKMFSMVNKNWVSS
ncbi:hypothetical protein LWI28_017293 [Acer negundo]|uniref:Integrase zinc-binding domain-containing protein n=1 Tax=Acer negundo TaxID=4023 RepID=A0AAD5J5W6_ACENE|nr:hypothetical protein LWI28_017293 [Acer negundo]